MTGRGEDQDGGDMNGGDRDGSGARNPAKALPQDRPGHRWSGLIDRLARALGSRGLAPGKAWRRAAADAGVPARERFHVVHDDLLREYTLPEVEAHERSVDPLGGVAPVPFGHLNPVWQRFVAALQPGDRIWRFNAQRISASGEAIIRSGYVAVRAGIPQRPLVASFRTLDADAPLGELTASTAPVTRELVSPPGSSGDATKDGAKAALSRLPEAVTIE